MADLGTVGQSARTGVAAGSVVKPAALGGLAGGVRYGAIGKGSGIGAGTIVSPLARVQYKTSVSATDTTSQAVTLDVAPVEGNLLVLTAAAGATMPTPSGWTSRSVTVDFCELEQWQKIAGPSESATITVAPSSAAACAMIVEEYQGSVAAPFDVQVSASPTTTPASISPGTTAATAQADEIAIAAVGYVRVAGASSKTVTAWSNGFVQTVQLEGVAANTNNNVNLVLATRVLRGTGTQTTTATFSAAQDHPSALLATYRASREIPVGGTTQALAGTSAGTSASTGDLAVSHPLEGASSSTSTSTGELSVAHSLTGVSASTSTTTGGLAGTLALLAGTSAGTDASSGALAVTHSIAGTSTSTSTSTGDMLSAVGLAGLSAGTSTTAGALTVSVALAGTSAGASVTTGALVLAWALAGISTGAATTTGALSITGPVVPVGRLEGSGSATYAESGASVSSVEFSGGVLALVE